MRALGLDPTYGAYLDALPGTTLATVNLITLFGLHRRWRGALVGNLAVYEMTSVVPMGTVFIGTRTTRCRHRGTRVLRRSRRCRRRASGHRAARPRRRLGARRARAATPTSCSARGPRSTSRRGSRSTCSMPGHPASRHCVTRSLRRPDRWKPPPMSCPSGGRPARPTTNSREYLAEIGSRCELIVVDGSDAVSFDARARGVVGARTPCPPG